MAGTISSLGIGSGVLTADVIEKLKENDRSLTVTPIEDKITLTQQKTAAIDLLDSLLGTFKSSTSALSDDTIFQNRTVSGNTDGVSVTASSGVAQQSFSITDTLLAKTNVLQSGSFYNADESVATGSGSMLIYLDGEEYEIEYDNATSLSDLKDEINTLMDGKATASILQTGEDAYSLILTSDDTGADQTFSVVDLDGSLKDELVTDSQISGTFTSANSTIASTGASGAMQFTIAGEDYSIDYDDTTTLSELADLINEESDLGRLVRANVVQYGDSDYRLVITPTSEAEGETVTITDTGASKGLDSSLYDTYDLEAGVETTESFTFLAGTSFSSGDFTNNTGVEIFISEADSGVVGGVTIPIDGTLSVDFTLQNDVTLDAGILINNTISQPDGPTVTTGDMSVVQDARDASFKYNGITLTRSSNEIDDIISGITIKLLKDDETANISITQDQEPISSELSTMVNSYNTLMDQLDDMTTSNVEEGKVGVFNGDNTINNIRREINRIITNYTDDGLSLTQFGISLTEAGRMTYSSSDFYDKMDEDPSAAEIFFSGLTEVDDNGLATYTNGVFDDLKDLLANYLKSDGYVGAMQTGFDNEYKNLLEERTRTVALLDARYDTMTAQFIQYDAIISRLESSFSSLNMLIQQELN